MRESEPGSLTDFLSTVGLFFLYRVCFMCEVPLPRMPTFLVVLQYIHMLRVALLTAFSEEAQRHQEEQTGTSEYSSTR